MQIVITLRALIRNPGFSIPAVAMLALGIAANTVMFSIFNGLFLKSLPLPDARQLLYLYEAAPSRNVSQLAIAYLDFNAWRAGNKSFDGMSAFREDGAYWFGVGETTRVTCARVTYDMGTTLGVRPILGRDFLPGDDHPNSRKVTLVSYRLWQGKLSGRRDIVGQVVQLDNVPYEVIGVLPQNAVFPSDADLWMPVALDTSVVPGASARILQAIGRVKHNVSIAVALADLTRIHKSLIPQRRVNEFSEPTVIPLRERYLSDYRTVTQVLLIAVSLVLLIACVNVASLMMVRGIARSHELAIRSALGSGLGRLVAQVLTETSLLAAGGGGLGLVMGWLGFRSVLSLLPDVLPSWVVFSFDARLVLFVLGVTCAAALLSALLPVIQLSKADLQALLASTGPRTSWSGRSRRAKDVLVIAEVFLALVLVAACGLILKAFVRVTNTDPGFRARDLVTFALDPPYGWPGPLDNVKLINFYDELLGRLRSAPGVESAGIASDLPFSTGRGVASLQWIGYYQPEGSPRPAPNEYQQVFNRVVFPGYFSTMGIPLKSGRDFDTHDDTSSAVSVIVNEAFVRHFWPAATDVIGKRVEYLGPPVRSGTVIGVIGDVHYAGLDREILPEAYLPYHQFPFPQMFIAVRGQVGPQALLATSADIIGELDPSLALYDASTMSDREYRSLWARHTYSWLFAALAGIALLLAVVGIYSATSYSVEQRVREISIRIALGADTSKILYQVLREGMTLVAFGISIGLLVVFLGARFLRSFLAGVSPNDPWVLLTATVALVGAAAIANFVPAWRATRTSVGIALREP